MTTKRIIYTRPDGGCAVFTPSDNFLGRFKTGAQGLAAARARAIPAGAVNVRTIEKTDLPDRAFRNAWRWDGAAVAIDLPLAREIHADHLAGAMEAEDADLARVEETARLAGRAADAATAAAARAALANLDRTALGSQIAAASTPADLLAVWPPELDARRPA